MTTQHENCQGVYFLTRHRITARYQVVGKRLAGSSTVKYWLSTGGDVKAIFDNMGDAIQEAYRRQAWIDRK